MDLGIKGKKAIVCASSRGLGRACATSLAREGVDVVLNGRTAETLAEAAESIRALGAGSVRSVVADISTAEGRQALLAACPELAEFDRAIEPMLNLDPLVHSADGLHYEIA